MDKGDKKKVGQTRVVAMNNAFAAWGGCNTCGSGKRMEGPGGIHSLFHSLPAAIDPMSTRQLEPLTEMVQGSAICNPASFLDSEHNIRTILTAGTPAQANSSRWAACYRNGE